MKTKDGIPYNNATNTQNGHHGLLFHEGIFQLCTMQ
jgi:hypothetical protein